MTKVLVGNLLEDEVCIIIPWRWHRWVCCRCVRADGDCAASGHQRAHSPCRLHEQDGPGPADPAAGGGGPLPDLPAHHRERQRHCWHLRWRWGTHGRHFCEFLGTKGRKGGSRVHADTDNYTKVEQWGLIKMVFFNLLTTGTARKKK